MKYGLYIFVFRFIIYSIIRLNVYTIRQHFGFYFFSVYQTEPKNTQNSKENFFLYLTIQILPNGIVIIPYSICLCASFINLAYIFSQCRLKPGMSVCAAVCVSESVCVWIIIAMRLSVTAGGA